VVKYCRAPTHFKRSRFTILCWAAATPA
jgi:hypothetical protein